MMRSNLNEARRLVRRMMVIQTSFAHSIFMADPASPACPFARFTEYEDALDEMGHAPWEHDLMATHNTALVALHQGWLVAVGLEHKATKRVVYMWMVTVEGEAAADQAREPDQDAAMDVAQQAIKRAQGAKL